MNDFLRRVIKGNVRLIGPSSVDEMVLAFLRAEVNGPRWQKAFADLDRRLIDQPNPNDAAENKSRADALARHRGDARTRTGFFRGLPLDTIWQRWAVTADELGDVCYAKYVTWERLSGGTRRIRDGAANVGRLQVFEDGHDINAGIRTTARAIDGGQAMEELIGVSKASDGSGLVLMEGHTRATAYLIARHPPAEVILLVGWSATMEWYLF